ncbi:sulfite exporter TauE/SafE family protein [Marinagarivorans algicola]|uniref:sulfite exporter TauE/SafE family protein n=1 Tax=Marinagarivorans algicola TaxID=1513270 RepID=UPI0006B68306|nr:sulfite exporter TauE/SafE family protein [Marinagarivorans algicola]
MFELLALLIFPAVMAGLIAGLFGLGGGAVIVPAVFYVLTEQAVAPEVAINIAVATSLATIVLTGATSALSHHRLDHVDWVLVWRWLPFLLLGALLGSTIVARFKTPGLIIFFGLFLWCVALISVLRSQAVRSQQRDRVDWAAPAWKMPVIVFLIGAVSSLVGVGGGTMSVPTLTAMGRSIHRAIGTSAAMGVALALMATLWMLLTFEPTGVDNTLGLVYWPAYLTIMPCTLIFAPLGAKLSQRIAAHKLNMAFMLLLLIVGARMIWVGVS